MVYDLIEELPVKGEGILKDQIIVWKKGLQLRRVTALVEVDGKEREMTFLTNNLQWSARTVADLYKLPVGDRGVLQTAQTNLPGGGLPRQQRQRGALAGLERAPPDAAPALQRLGFPVGLQLPAALRPGPLDLLAEMGLGKTS